MILNPFVFGGAAPSILPTIADNNDSFNDEGTATTDWTASNATLSVSGSWLRETKSSGGVSSSMVKAMTFTPVDQDYILYGKARASVGTNHIGVIWFLNGSKEVSIWFGSGNASTSYAAGNVSICGTTGTSTRNVANAQGGLSYDSTAVEFALHFDKKWGQLNCFFLESGKWRFKCRVACDFFSSTQMAVLNTSATPVGGWCEIDHLTLCKPNVISIGDSICEGAVLFSPDPTDGLTNNTNTWQYHCQIYQSLRNNLIVNKGVGSQTSAQIEARVVADVLDHDPRVVFLHASTNDEGASISLSTRSTNIQNTIDSISSAGASCVLLNAMYGTSDSVDNPALRDYMVDWWDNYSPSLTDCERINVMLPLLDGGFMDSALTESDDIHPTADGYQDIGQLIASS